MPRNINGGNKAKEEKIGEKKSNLLQKTMVLFTQK